MLKSEIWNFTSIFESIHTKSLFINEILEACEQFPPDMLLTVDDFHSLFSVLVSEIPDTFVLFVCECVNPSMTSATVLSHKMEFGNFLLAFPCAVFFPHFLDEVLSTFKKCDLTRKGLIPTQIFIDNIETIIEQNAPVVQDLTKIYPNPNFTSILRESTRGFKECSFMTLLFVLWQSEPVLSNLRRNVSEIATTIGSITVQDVLSEKED